MATLSDAAFLQDCIISAAKKVGRDGRGTGELEGYLITLAERHPRTFAQLLQKIIPTKLADPDGEPLTTPLMEIRLVSVAPQRALPAASPMVERVDAP